jgi:hypothetical protein
MWQKARCYVIIKMVDKQGEAASSAHIDMMRCYLMMQLTK